MKKVNQYSTLLAFSGILLLSACAGAGGSGRKKMPDLVGGGNDFSTNHLFQSSPVFEQGEVKAPFSTSFTSVAFNGGAKECVAVALPESADQQAIALIGLYKPFATTLISQWAKQQSGGVVLDFSDGTDQKRSDYIVESKGNPDVPVIVLWNERSSKRVASYIAQFTDVPGVSLKTISK